MWLAYFLLAIVSFIYILKREGTLITPSSIIVTTWCVFPGIASLQPLGLYEFSIDTHFAIILSLISFLCAYYYVLSLKPYSSTPKTPTRIKESTHVNYTLLIILNLSFFFWLFPKTIASWAAIQVIGWDGLRGESFDMFGSTAANLIYECLARPLFVACLAIISVDLLRSFKINLIKILFLILVIINITQDTIIFAARATLIKVVIYFLFSYLYVNRSILTKKKKLLFVLLLVIMYNIIALVTEQRNAKLSSGGSFLDTIVTYYIAPFGVLNYYINHDVISLIGADVMTYGTCIIGFIYNIFCIFSTVFLGAKYGGTDSIVTQVTAENVYVSPNLEMNAACTANYAFLSDFGFLGIIIGFMLCALVILRVRKRYIINPCIRNGAIYIFMLYTLFRLSVNYDFLFPSALFSLLYIWMGTVTKKELRSLFRL